MAHGLVLVTDSYGQDRAPMFSVQKTPWHGLGIVCKDAPTIAEGIKMAGLDWKTELHPLQFLCKHTGMTHDIPNEQCHCGFEIPF